MNKEVWKDVIGYEGLYQVSNYGRVKSLKFNKEQILKPGINSSGYFHVNLCKKSKSKNFRVHRLVALHFISNSKNKPQVNHIDGDKLNNNINNLEWVFPFENIKHAYDNGLCENVRKAARKTGKKYGKINGSINGKKYLSKKVKCIETGIVYESTMDAKRQTGINHSNISKCCKGKLKSAGKKIINGKLTKLTWQYI